MEIKVLLVPQTSKGPLGKGLNIFRQINVIKAVCCRQFGRDIHDQHWKWRLEAVGTLDFNMGHLPLFVEGTLITGHDFDAR